MKRLLMLLVLSVTAFWAADVAGTWKATAEGPNGRMERAFVFNVDGDKLSGETTSSIAGKSAIVDGKIDGDKLSFTITAKIQDNERTIHYKGKVTGNEIQLTSEIDGGGGQAIEWRGKKVQ